MINYQDAMITLSQCGLGMIILSEDGRILEISEEGDRLHHGEGALPGKFLAEVAPDLLTESSLLPSCPTIICLLHETSDGRWGWYS